MEDGIVGRVGTVQIILIVISSALATSSVVVLIEYDDEVLSHHAEKDLLSNG